MRKFLGVISARKGSKGLPGKNTRALLGRPLVQWTMAATQNISLLDMCVVSTNDKDVVNLAQDHHIEVIQRPEHLATDEARIVDVLLHVSDLYPEYTDLVLLQPTSPLRLKSDIEGALELAVQNPGASVISVAKNRKSPFWSYKVNNLGLLEAVFEKGSSDPRQSLTQTYLPNGAIYIAEVEQLRNQGNFLGAQTLPFIMPYERSIDIDDEFDFRIAEFLASANSREI